MSTTVEDLQEQEPTRETDEAPEQSAEEAPLITKEGEAGQESADQQIEQPKPKGNDPQRRISQYRARLARAEEQREYWREQALRAQVAPKAPEQPEPEPAPPKLADFQGSVEKFAEAQTKYVQDVRAYDKRQSQRAEEQRRREGEAQSRTAQVSERQQQQLAMLQKGQAKYEDFDDVVYDPSLMISNDMLEIATDLENGPDVLYALGQKPVEAARIAAMTGRAAVLAMAQFAATMGQVKAKGSGAPPPPKPAKGGADTAHVDEDKLSTGEAIRRDRARRAKLGRR